MFSTVFTIGRMQGADGSGGDNLSLMLCILIH